MDNKLGTHSWYQRVNLSIFHGSGVDTYDSATQYLAYEYTSREFFYDFPEETIGDDRFIMV